MKRERNCEVLRTVAMFFIVVYHCLTHGVGDGYEFSSTSPICLTNALSSDLMLVFSSIAVNLYVMISGYFLVDLNFKASRIVRTWSVACFYSFIIALLFMTLCLIPFNLLSLFKSLFPISFDAYWFVTQYIGMLILSPFLAIMVRNLTYRQYFALLIAGAFICLAIILHIGQWRVVYYNRSLSTYITSSITTTIYIMVNDKSVATILIFKETIIDI